MSWVLGHHLIEAIAPAHITGLKEVVKINPEATERMASRTILSPAM